MAFDTQSFLSSATTSANDTRVIPCPVGTYQALIEKVEARQWQSKDGSKSGVALDVTWSIEDADVKSALNRENVSVRQGVMLDTKVTAEGKIVLDDSTGKNIGLGRLREAVGKNRPGETFSFDMLPGLMANVTVSHREGETSDDVFPEIKKVGRL
jgi:hypothetical protein